MADVDRQPPKYDTVMDVTEEQIARVYAQAFLNAIVKSPKAAELVDELQSFVADVLATFPRFKQMLDSEFVEQNEKLSLLDRVLVGRASVEVLNFLKVLAVRGRLTLLRSIARIAAKLYAQQLGHTDVEVRVARELDEVLHREVLQELRARLSTEPVMRVVVDPSLIAGIMVRVGDTVYDGSVRTQFELVRKSMISRATELIETQRERFVGA